MASFPTFDLNTYNENIAPSSSPTSWTSRCSTARRSWQSSRGRPSSRSSGWRRSAEEIGLHQGSSAPGFSSSTATQYHHGRCWTERSSETTSARARTTRSRGTTRTSAPRQPDGFLTSATRCSGAATSTSNDGRPLRDGRLTAGSTASGSAGGSASASPRPRPDAAATTGRASGCSARGSRHRPGHDDRDADPDGQRRRDQCAQRHVGTPAARRAGCHGALRPGTRRAGHGRPAHLARRAGRGQGRHRTHRQQRGRDREPPDPTEIDPLRPAEGRRQDRRRRRPSSASSSAAR